MQPYDYYNKCILIIRSVIKFKKKFATFFNILIKYLDNCCLFLSLDEDNINNFPDYLAI